jgi:hypothetical protein
MGRVDRELLIVIENEVASALTGHWAEQCQYGRYEQMD